MDDAGDGQDDQKGISEIAGERDAVVGGEDADLCEGQEMVGKRGEVAFVMEQNDRDANPIGGEQSQYRSDDGAQAEAADKNHQDPVDGDDYQQVNLCQTGQTEEEKRVIDQSRSFAVLVRGKER